MKTTFLLLTGLALFAFKSNAQSTFTDPRDGNVYQTITIGTQVWMAENLRYLPSVVGSATGSSTTPYYYVYGFEGTNVTDAKATANYTTYGVLYNWPAAMAGSASSTANPSGVQGVCPTGWHLPSDAEWMQLTNYLGGDYVAGGKLKETGTTHWNSPNVGATNETGFTALPGGYRVQVGAFYDIGKVGYWWSATAFSTNNAYYWHIGYSTGGIGRDFNPDEVGFSVRCICSSANNVQESNEYKKIQIFPNPATDRITINIAETQNVQMQIYDMVGKCVLTSNMKDGTNDINVSLLPKGIFVVHVSDNNQAYQIKLIKR